MGSHPASNTSLSNLLEDRYKTPMTFAAPTIEPLSETLRAILTHKSTRSFLSTSLPPGILEILITCAQSAPTSSMQQSYSIIPIQDPKHKEAVSHICGDQDFIRQAPLFLIFCADLHRMGNMAEKYGVENQALDKMDMLLTGIIDASLAAQNAALASESLGLGTCFVGGVRNHAAELIELLGLPERVCGVIGLAVGFPDPSIKVDIKPRLPMSEVLHYERWNSSRQEEGVRVFDEVMGRHRHRLSKIGRKPWSQWMGEWGRDGVSGLDGREKIRALLEDQGFGMD
ncbi:NADPH-dependent oxidoreductase [Aspergillus stella-maris]|uniref:NADPH-dependent oxidoreductase n=1 Tax=Aspergillus stella-maris TaxID=1810926 RepID=UPI003CCCD7FA